MSPTPVTHSELGNSCSVQSDVISARQVGQLEEWWYPERGRDQFV